MALLLPSALRPEGLWPLLAGVPRLGRARRAAARAARAARSSSISASSRATT